MAQAQAATQKVVTGIAKGLQEYVNPHRLANFKKSTRDQMLEIEGMQPFAKGLYHNTEYESLIQGLVETRKAFRASNDAEERRAIAKTELSNWSNFVSVRKEQLTEDFQIPAEFASQLDQAWGLVKNRKESNVHASKMLELHYEIMNQFKFKVPIEPKLLVQMIHPHHGYLTQFPGSFSKEELLEIYKCKLVASMERSLGQDFLASEIAAFTYWKIFDTKMNGSFDFKTFSEFMKVFRFTLDGSASNFEQEFKFALNIYPGEINPKISEGNQVIRFDLFRYLFLERNL